MSSEVEVGRVPVSGGGVSAGVATPPPPPGDGVVAVAPQVGGAAFPSGDVPASAGHDEQLFPESGDDSDRFGPATFDAGVDEADIRLLEADREMHADEEPTDFEAAVSSPEPEVQAPPVPGVGGLPERCLVWSGWCWNAGLSCLSWSRSSRCRWNQSRESELIPPQRPSVSQR